MKQVEAYARDKFWAGLKRRLNERLDQLPHGSKGLLADKCGIHRNTLRNILEGPSVFDAYQLSVVCRFCEISAGELMGIAKTAAERRRETLFHRMIGVVADVRQTMDQFDHQEKEIQGLTRGAVRPFDPEMLEFDP